MASFEDLNHDKVLDLAEKALGQPCSPLCLPRNSYINRVFECELNSTREKLILKFYRPGRWTKDQILEEHRFLKRLSDDDISVILPMVILGKSLHEHEGFLFSVSDKMGGRALDEFTEDLYKEVGRLLARVHVSGKAYEVEHRPVWTPEKQTVAHLETILKHAELEPDYETLLKETVQAVIEHISPLFHEDDLQFIHGDCHFGNMIHRPNEGLYLLDFDDCVKGPVMQDIWMLLPNQSTKDEQEIRWLAEGYSVFADFPYYQLNLIPALRAMRQIHFMAWCAMQSKEPHFKHHFPGWGSTQYWNEGIKELQHLNV